MTQADISNPLVAFADWTASASNNWPAAARHQAWRAFIDIAACMIPGATLAVATKLWSVMQDQGEGPCNIAGQNRKLPPIMAALMNGTCAHAMDFDDDFDPAKCHPTAVLAPALMALGDARGKSGADLIDAYIVGLQVIGRVGQGVNPFHRSRGWHATGTIAAVGAAAGCARLLRLDTEKTANAISMATSLAGGFVSQFGTDTKPMHAGFAAAGAVQAALFAESGLTAGRGALDGDKGMGTLMVGPDIGKLRDQMADKDQYGQKVRFDPENVGEPLHILEYGLKVKRFPNCGSVHRSLDGLLALKAQHAFGPEDVEEIFVRAPAAHMSNLMYERPTDAGQAKFSLEYGLAVGLLTGNATLADYTDEAVNRPEVTALLPLIRKEAVDRLESEFPTQIHVKLKDGRTLHTKVSMAVGTIASPLSDVQLWAKFDTCLAGVVDSEKATRIRTALEGLDSEVPASCLTSLL